MLTKFSFNSTSGFFIVLTAETRAEEAILHLLYEAKDRFTVMTRDTEWHESYKLTKQLELSEVKPHA